MFTIPLSAKVHQGNAPGRPTRQGTCEIVFTANPDLHFVATPMHIFMTGEEMATLDAEIALIEHDQSDMLAEINERFLGATVSGKRIRASSMQVDLENNVRPLYSYRTHAGSESPFMSDITLLPLTVQFLTQQIRRGMSDDCFFEDVVPGPISLDGDVDEALLQPGILRASGNRFGTVVDMRDSPAGSRVGHQLAFYLENG